MGIKNSKVYNELDSNHENNTKDNTKDNTKNNVYDLQIQLEEQIKINQQLNEEITNLNKFYTLQLNSLKYKINVLNEKLEKYENK